MSKIGIAVVSYDRPNHLYVTLDSIYRMGQIGLCNVHTFLIDNNTIGDRVAIIRDLPTERVIIRQRGGDAFIETFRYMFHICGYEQVLLFGDDAIVRTDLLNYVFSLDDSDTKILVDCFGGDDGRKQLDNIVPRLLTHNFRCAKGTFNLLAQVLPWLNASGGIRLLKHNFDLLDRWVGSDECISAFGQYWSYTPYRFDLDYFLLRYMQMRGYLGRFAPIFYAVHFGILGIHTPGDIACKDFEDRMFTGSKENWLDNIVSLVSSEEVFHPDIEWKICPRHFVYG